MARYEINGQIYEVPDEVQGEQLVQTLTMLSEQTAAPVAQPVQQPESAAQPEPEERGLLQRYVADPALETVAAINRGASQAADFLTTEPANAILQLSGSERRVPSITEALSPATAGGFMEPGLARDVVRGAGEVVGPGALAGGVFRAGAQRLPQMGRAGESLLSGTLRQVGSSTPAQDVGFSALSGGGAALGGAAGEGLGGDTGRQVGEFAGGLLAPIAGGLRPMRGRVADSEAPRLPSEEQLIAREAAEATGVSLMPAQQSLDPQQLRSQRFLPELTPATERAAQALSRQNQQASGAVDEFVRSIAPDDAVVTAAGSFRNASQRALDARRAIRSEKASPIYQQAFSEGAQVELRPVNEAIERTISEFPEGGAVARAAQKVGRMLSLDASLKQLHNAKLEIDDMLTKVGDGSLGNTAKRELRNVKQSLVDQMEAASPAYRDARLTFEAESPAVTQLEESIIGKIANLDDTQLKNVSRRIFDPAETNPTVVRRAKQVIEEVDPDAWNRLVRAEVERRIGSIRPEVGTSFENIPGKLNRAIFGTGKQRDALLSGLSGEQRRNAELLETALTRASLGRPGGSETAGRQQFIRELDTGIVSALRNFVRNPVDRAVGIGESAAFDRRAKALADALFDPAWSGEAKEAFKDRSGKAFGFLLYRVNDALESLDRTQDQREQESQQQQAP
jgi:hypothetical protein